MTQRSVDPAAIEAEVDHIRSLGIDALRARWRTMFGALLRGRAGEARGKRHRAATAPQGLPRNPRGPHFRRPRQQDDTDAHEQARSTVSVLCLARDHAEEK